MAATSRRKGAVGEREVADLLRAWLGPDWTVRRRPQDRQRSHEAGGDLDVTGPAPFPFAIEVKRDGGWDERCLLAPSSAVLARFWRQAREQAAACGRRPLLLARRNRGPWVVVVRREDAAALRLGVPTVRAEVEGDEVVATTWGVWARVGAGMLVEVT